MSASSMSPISPGQVWRRLMDWDAVIALVVALLGLVMLRAGVRNFVDAAWRRDTRWAASPLPFRKPVLRGIPEGSLGSSGLVAVFFAASATDSCSTIRGDAFRLREVAAYMLVTAVNRAPKVCVWPAGYPPVGVTVDSSVKLPVEGFVIADRHGAVVYGAARIKDFGRASGALRLFGTK